MTHSADAPSKALNILFRVIPLRNLSSVSTTTHQPLAASKIAKAPNATEVVSPRVRLRFVIEETIAGTIATSPSKSLATRPVVVMLHFRDISIHSLREGRHREPIRCIYI